MLLVVGEHGLVAVADVVRYLVLVLVTDESVLRGVVLVAVHFKHVAYHRFHCVVQ